MLIRSAKVRVASLVTAVGALILAGPQPTGLDVHLVRLAYIDPVSGSILLQALIAAIIGLLAYFRHWLGRGLSALRGMKKRSDGPRSD